MMACTAIDSGSPSSGRNCPSRAFQRVVSTVPSPAARAAYHDLIARIFDKMAEIHDPLLSQAQLLPR